MPEGCWELLDRADRALKAGLFDAAVILSVKALEIGLREAFGIPELHRAGLIDMMFFGRDHGVRIPFWDELHHYRRLRNYCLHSLYLPSEDEARGAVEFARKALRAFERLSVPENVARKAYLQFRVDPDYKRKMIRRSIWMLFLGTFMFSTGVDALVLLSFAGAWSPPGLITSFLLPGLVIVGFMVIVLSLRLKSRLRVL